VLEEIGEDHLHISKGDALATAILEIDMSICTFCTERVFTECGDLPGAGLMKSKQSAT
jgi:sulfate permease, SulP family